MRSDKATDAVRRLAILLLLISGMAFGDAETQWPSSEQIQRVEALRASFPVSSYVYDVDWFSPLEVVAGATSPQRLAVADTSPAWADAAIELARQHNSYALLVWQHGQLMVENYWHGFTADTLFETASMHKSLVPLVLGLAVERGLVGNVEDTLSTYLPELAGSGRGQISLRQLLDMSSGIKTPPLSDDSANPYWQNYFGNDLHQAVDHWPFFKKEMDHFHYANANTQYLGWVIENASGQRYADFLSKALWQPIGADAARLWLDHPGGSARLACCLQATARDWLRVGILLATGGKTSSGKRLIAEDWITQMLAPSAANPNYGWQIWRGSPHNPKRMYDKDIPAVMPAKAPFAADDVFFMDGSGGQRVYAIPSAQTVIVRIGAPSYTWDDSALPNIVLQAHLWESDLDKGKKGR